MNLVNERVLKKIFCGLILLVLMAAPAISMAQGLDPNSIGLDYGAYSGLRKSDLRLTIISIVRMLMGLLGIIAVIIMIYSGFTWMTAGGNEEKIGKAKKLLFYCAIGLAIILSAYAITSFVLFYLANATTGRVFWGSLW